MFNLDNRQNNMILYIEIKNQDDIIKPLLYKGLIFNELNLMERIVKVSVPKNDNNLSHHIIEEAIKTSNIKSLIILSETNLRDVVNKRKLATELIVCDEGQLSKNRAQFHISSHIGFIEFLHVNVFTIKTTGKISHPIKTFNMNQFYKNKINKELRAEIERYFIDIRG